MSAWEPNPSVPIACLLKADGAVRKVMGLPLVPLGLGAIEVPGRVVPPDSRGRAQPFESTVSVLIGASSLPRRGAPVG